MVVESTAPQLQPRADRLLSTPQAHAHLREEAHGKPPDCQETAMAAVSWIDESAGVPSGSALVLLTMSEEVLCGAENVGAPLPTMRQ
jgi:hypothetical protein